MYDRSKLKTVMATLVAVVLSLLIFTNSVDAEKITVNNAPVITQGETAYVSLNEDGSGTVVLNATDTDRDALSWVINKTASNGKAWLGIKQGAKGTSRMAVTYKPTANYNGLDSFVVQVKDGKGGISAITVNVTIHPVNDKPVNIAKPSICGTPAVGCTITANAGRWSADTPDAIAYTYLWQYSDDANELNAAVLQGASGDSYVLAAEDAGKYIRIKVTAQDYEGLSADSYSEWTLVSSDKLPAVKAINYVALGDSIATGAIYPRKMIPSYVTYFYQFLKAQNSDTEVTLKNLAANGCRTNELYSELGLASDPGDPALISAIETADIITLSIGGNNLMQAAMDSSALGGYNFSNIDTAVAEQGVNDFNSQWKPIINKIKSLNSHAQIIVMTIFNPYDERDKPLRNSIDSYLFKQDRTGINDVILDNAELGYEIADVYGEFTQNYRNNMGAISYFYPEMYDLWGMMTRNPHPNEDGQNIIARLHKAVYEALD